MNGCTSTSTDSRVKFSADELKKVDCKRSYKPFPEIGAMKNKQPPICPIEFMCEVEDLKILYGKLQWDIECIEWA